MVVALLVYARRKGVNLSALGIGVDFLQVVSLFSSFGFTWPTQLTSLFNASSVSSFNEQLMAPECSLGTWSFARKYGQLSPPPFSGFSPGRVQPVARGSGADLLVHRCVSFETHHTAQV